MAVYVVTGCTNGGLGYHCVKSLYSQGGDVTVVLACRNVAAAKEAAAMIWGGMTASCGRPGEECTGSGLVVLETPLELSDCGSVRAYAAALRVWLGTRRITGLVNNAGSGGSPNYEQNEKGHEMIFATNYLGHFLLTVLLLSSMSRGGRIINVSSEVHDPATETTLPDPGQFWPSNFQEYEARLLRGEPCLGEEEDAETCRGRRYSRSKLCNVLSTNELARRLSGAVPFGADEMVARTSQEAVTNASCKLPTARSLTVIAMNPGLMLDTNFVTGVVGDRLGWVAYALSPVLLLMPIGKLMRSGSGSGEDLAVLACGGGDAQAATAAFYSGHEVHPSSEFSRSREVVMSKQVELWNHSLTWAQVVPRELMAAGLASSTEAAGSLTVAGLARFARACSEGSQHPIHPLTAAGLTSFTRGHSEGSPLTAAGLASFTKAHSDGFIHIGAVKEVSL
ncbi:unnamed protein product [Polarella glacialis]|uniref:Protochlorophyllide reductase n=1 Tax=Polarella glacialis TaxID=89957 RepID=A0A813GW54_POLGL|nr:unnamed protein product [Polarella glacialis]